MVFKFCNHILPGYSIKLEALEKDTNLYTTLLFQCKGKFDASETKFGNHINCTDNFTQFIRLAISEKVSLAVTPEYSCPF